SDSDVLQIYTLSLHDALPIYAVASDEERLGADVLEPRLEHDVVPDLLALARGREVDADPLRRRDDLDGLREDRRGRRAGGGDQRSEEHTSELQSRRDLVCRLL